MRGKFDAEARVVISSSVMMWEVSEVPLLSASLASIVEWRRCERLRQACTLDSSSTELHRHHTPHPTLASLSAGVAGCNLPSPDFRLMYRPLI